MQTGTVKFFNEQKGYGFIVNNTTKEEVFLHVTGLIDAIVQGDTVTYEVKEGRKGLNAVDVKKA